jgi:hypothetical protein
MRCKTHSPVPVPVVVHQTMMRTSVSAAEAVMETPLQVMMTAQRVVPMMRMAQNVTRALRQRTHGDPRCNVPAVRCLAGDAAHSATGNGGNHFEQMPRLRIAMQGASHLANSLGEVRRSLGYRARYLRQHPLGGRSHGSGYHRQQFAGCHPNQWKKVFGGLILGFGFRRQLTQVFHHCIRVDLANGTDLVFEFILELALVFVFVLVFFFTFSQKAAGDVAKGSEKAFAFELVLELFFAFKFPLVLQLFLEFGQGFQFIFKLVGHDDSSSNRWLSSAGVSFQLQA